MPPGSVCPKYRALYDTKSGAPLSTARARQTVVCELILRARKRGARARRGPAAGRPALRCCRRASPPVLAPSCACAFGRRRSVRGECSAVAHRRSPGLPCSGSAPPLRNALPPRSASPLCNALPHSSGILRCNVSPRHSTSPPRNATNPAALHHSETLYRPQRFPALQHSTAPQNLPAHQRHLAPQWFLMSQCVPALLHYPTPQRYPTNQHQLAPQWFLMSQCVPALQ